MTTVLVAEDDADVRDLVVFKLEQAGFTVIPAADGSQALSTARASAPDMAILDLSMPGVSGLDICRLLRADPATSRMPIIILTARAQPGDVDSGHRAGADDYIIKPFSPRELTTRVAALMAKAPHR